MDDRTLMLPGADPMAPHLLAAAAFLARYSNPNTRRGYATDLRIFFAWCQRNGLDPLKAIRPHVQMFVCYLQDERGYQPAGIQRTMCAVRGYYRLAVRDCYRSTDPTDDVTTPKVIDDPTRKSWLDRWELSALIRAAAAANARDWAMVHLLGTLGMRIGAVCDIRIEHLAATADGYQVLRTVGKGGIASLKALPIPVAVAVAAAQGDQTAGYLLLRRGGKQLTRRFAAHRLEILCRDAGISKDISPHSLRRSHVTIALEAGVPLHVVQQGVDHADSRTTLRYNTLRVPVHGQTAHTLAALLSSAG